MKENTRVKLSILLWIAVAVAFIYCGIYVYNNVNPETPATTAEQSTTDVSPFDTVANGFVESGEFAGIAIALVEKNGTFSSWGYGSLANAEDNNLCDIATLDYALQLIERVEQGSITLDEALLAISRSDDVTSMATLNEAAYLVAIVLGEGSVNDDRLLSQAAIKALLTPAFGWNMLPYGSLLSPAAVELCTSNSAIVVDVELGIALVVVVDHGVAVKDSFASLRSRLASIAAAGVEG